MRRRLSPRSEALAYRAYCIAKPLGWDITISQLANRLDCSQHTLIQIIDAKGWTDRLRPSHPKGYNISTAELKLMEELRGQSL